MSLALSRFVIVSSLLIGCGPAVADPVEDGSSTGNGESGGSTSGADSASTSAATSAGPTTTTGPATTDSTGSTGGSADSSADSTGNPGFEPLCATDREWELSISGTNLDEHEGRTVWASAVEPTQEADVVAVRLAAEISGGEFDLLCADGLSTNSWYPSIAVVIDADQDGSCSDGDLAFVWQLFAWMSDQRYAFEGNAAYSLETDPPWLIAENAWQPVSNIGEVWGQPFCDYYLAP